MEQITIVTMSDDWNTVTVLRGKQAKPGAAKSSQAVNAARRRGEEVNTEQKYGAGGNKHGGTSLNTAKLDRETEELKHETVSMDVGRLIQKGRQQKVKGEIKEGFIIYVLHTIYTFAHSSKVREIIRTLIFTFMQIEPDPEGTGNKNMREATNC